MPNGTRNVQTMLLQEAIYLPPRIMQTEPLHIDDRNAML